MPIQNRIVFGFTDNSPHVYAECTIRKIFRLMKLDKNFRFASLRGCLWQVQCDHDVQEAITARCNDLRCLNRFYPIYPLPILRELYGASNERESAQRTPLGDRE